MVNNVTIYTDGACSGNPGPGGFGVVVFENNDRIPNLTHYEHSENTTNNREELKAILKAFEYAEKIYPDVSTILIYSDSAYCVNICNDWIFTWAKNNWINSKKKTIENKDLVEQLYKYISKDFFNCQVIKVKGHANSEQNELADALASNNRNKYNKIINTILKEENTKHEVVFK